MGRIKSTLVKRTSKHLVNDGHSFNEEFNHNKKILGRTMPSKKMRNKIAGYISRIVKMRRISAQEEQKRKEKAANSLPQYMMDESQQA